MNKKIVFFKRNFKFKKDKYIEIDVYKLKENKNLVQTHRINQNSYRPKINTNSYIQKNYLLDIYSYITEISRQTVKLRQSVVRGKNRNK